MRLTLAILTLPWTFTAAVTLFAASAAAVSRRARKVLAHEIWGD